MTPGAGSGPRRAPRRSTRRSPSWSPTGWPAPARASRSRSRARASCRCSTRCRLPASGSWRPATKVVPRSWPPRPPISPGEPQIVLATRTVGAANAAIGIHTARSDSAPLVALIGGVRREYRGREAFQESDLAAGIGSLAAWAVELERPTDAARVMAEAIRQLTTGRPGPILLALPEDVLGLSDRWQHAARSARPGWPGARPRRRPAGAQAARGVASRGHHRRRRHPAGTGEQAAHDPRGCPRGAGHRVLAATGRGAQRLRRVPGHDRLLEPLHRPRAARGGRCGARAGRPDVRDRHLRLPHPVAPGPAGSRSTWSLATPATGSRHRRCPSPRTWPGSWMSRGRTCVAPCSTRRTGPRAPRTSSRTGQAFLAASDVEGGEWSGPGVHPGRLVGDDAATAAAQRGGDHGRRQLRWLGGARLPVPATGHLPGSDIGRHGLWAAGGHRRVARPSRSAGRRGVR